MQYRKFGKTDLQVSAIGFGAWAIGGAAMAGKTPIGWGPADDQTSRLAIKQALNEGINFFDTADFYGLGHSEELLGSTIASEPDIIIATKVGHRLAKDQSIFTDYSKKWIKEACHASLQRLRRKHIDYYQLHTAKVSDLERGECIEAMEELKAEGKIRYWGLSLNTFHPLPEATYLFNQQWGDGFQLVFNIINQRALSILDQAGRKGFGVIARMPLQFGLLTGKYSAATRFPPDDHRSFRLHPALLTQALENLAPVWSIAAASGTTPTALSLRFILSFPEVSTVIPGMRTPGQVTNNILDLEELPATIKKQLQDAYQQDLFKLVKEMEKAG